MYVRTYIINCYSSSRFCLLEAPNIHEYNHVRHVVYMRGTRSQAYDPADTGFMDTEILRSIFSNLGFGEMSDADLAILVEAADGDGDGRVSLADFRGMCGSMGKREAAEVEEEANGNQERADQANEPT